MRKLVFILLLFLTACNYNAKKTITLSDECLVIDKYDKILCLDEKIDCNYKYIFLDKNRFESEDIKFTNLYVFDFTVVDLEINGVNKWVTFSNEKYSIRLIWDYGLPMIGEEYRIICKESQLKDSKLVKTNFSGIIPYIEKVS